MGWDTVAAAVAGGIITMLGNQQLARHQEKQNKIEILKKRQENLKNASDEFLSIFAESDRIGDELVEMYKESKHDSKRRYEATKALQKIALSGSFSKDLIEMASSVLNEYSQIINLCLDYKGEKDNIGWYIYEIYPKLALKLEAFIMLTAEEVKKLDEDILKPSPTLFSYLSLFYNWIINKMA